MEKKLSAWCKNAKIEMINRDLKTTTLAKELDMNRSYVSSILNGRVYSAPAVKKISDYITKKVADKLSGMCKTDKEEYEKYWDDISPFIKFGCLKDTKFCEKMSDYVLFKNLDDKYLTFKECLEENKGSQIP